MFDSGVGGLTVLRALGRRLPRESTVYLGDTARVPYGPKSPETVRRYADEAAAFLMGRGIKALVIACNTATAHARAHLAETLPVPVLGVVEPGAAEAARVSRSGRIGVIGTRGTIESGTYERAILRHRPDATVHARPCPLLVALAEEGWVSGPAAEWTAREYLAPLLERRIDTLVLGCTHYPLLRPLLSAIAGPEVVLVDSAEATAEATAALLETEGLAAGDTASARRTYFATDDAARFGELAARFLGGPVGEVVTASIDPERG